MRSKARPGSVRHRTEGRAKNGDGSVASMATGELETMSLPSHRRLRWSFAQFGGRCPCRAIPEE
jgi:hypothetical protein